MSNIQRLFRSATVPTQKDNRLCFSCLMRGHSSQEYRSKKECEKVGCNRWHHIMLHSDPPCASSASSALDRDCLMPVVRVLFRASNGKCREGNVLIDSGAGTTIIRKEFAQTLGLQGKREGLELSVVGGQRLKQTNSRRVKFCLQKLSGGEEFPVEAHEIDRTILSVSALDKVWTRSHLRDIDFSQKAGPMDLILGVQYSHLHAEDEVRQGKSFDAVGKLSKLGWYVIGSDKTKPEPSIRQVNFVNKMDLEKFYRFETLGIQAPNCSCPATAMSPEDKCALDLFESSCCKNGNRFVIGVPRKRDPSCLADNYDLARGLLSLENSLQRNASEASLYDKAIMEYENKGWAERVSEEETKSDEDRLVYYLPHHGVYRPDKVSTPLRVVFDPACQFRGLSLNSILLKGLCLIGNLFAVLLRFREDHVAFSGDISKMFLQIYLPEADTHVHRFLWRNMDTTRETDVYRLMRVTFGDKPSPDMASFVMLKIAKESEEKLPHATTILRRGRYMDDLIHSCATHEEAVQRMAEVDQALATGSFEIKRWILSAKKSISSVLCDAAGVPEMHIFADASGKAYGAVAYLRWPTECGAKVRLILAKGRVAPLRETTTPCLELMAALVASRLGKTIFEEFKVKPTSVVFWSDSHWLQSESVKLKAFVGVRVAEIQSTWDPGRWRFVPTELKPADDLSRGISVDEMNGRWKHRPDLLRRPENEWPEMTAMNVTDDPEMKWCTTVGTVIRKDPIIAYANYSSWQKLSNSILS